ncbi:hypothetical protein D3C87_1663080 [compost metagenome]
MVHPPEGLGRAGQAHRGAERADDGIGPPPSRILGQLLEIHDRRQQFLMRWQLAAGGRGHRVHPGVRQRHVQNMTPDQSGCSDQ